MTAPDTLLVLLAAILLDAYVGSPLRRRRWRWQPLVAADRIAGWCAARLDRESRGARTLRVRGALAVAVLAGIAVAGSIALDAAAARQPVLSLAVLFLFSGLVDQRESADALRRLGRALAIHDRAAAEAALAGLSMRDPVHLDSHGMGRVGVEAAMRRLARRWMAPVLYAAAAGAAGIAGYWLLDALAAAARPRGAFGAVPRRLARLAHWLPDRLTGLALAAAAALSGRPALAGLRGAAGADWPPAAAAAVLGVSLGGPRRYAGRVVPRPWIGRGRPQVGPNDIAAATGLHMLAVALATLILGAVCLVRLLQGVT